MSREVSWSDLLPDILRLIVLNLSAPEFAVFRSVCKSWRSIDNSAYRPLLTWNDIQNSGFPVLFTVHSKFCSLFHPLYNTTSRRVIPELLNARLFYTKHEWLLLDREDDNDGNIRKVFFFNICTMVKIDDVPCLPEGVAFKTMYFSSTPDSTDWRIIAMQDEYRMGTIKHGESTWTLNSFTLDDCDYLPFLLASPPIVSGNLCYSLEEKGNVVAFDLAALIDQGAGGGDGRTPLWKVSELPELLQNRQLALDEGFLINDGRLQQQLVLAIFMHKKGLKLIISAYEFNLLKGTWRRVKTLGNKMLFLGLRGSILLEAPTSATKNKIFYSRYQMENNGIFFSLDTGRYHGFLSEPNWGHGRRGDAGKFPQPSNSGWIRPMNTQPA